MADDAEINEQQDEVPMEPDDAAGQNEQAQQQQAQQQQAQQQQVQAPQIQQLQPGEPRLNRDHEEIPLMHRKIQRILGRTDDLNSMRNQVDSTHTRTTFPKKERKKPKGDDPSNTPSKAIKVRRIEERELHVVERRTFTLKEMMEESLDGLEQIFNLQKQMMAMLEELKHPPTREPSPQPGPSRQQQPPQQQPSNKCGFCDSPDHFAADCKQYFTLRDRSRRAFERNRCERCLKKATHLTTSCPSEKVCHYCKISKREKEMIKHNSAFCPHKFPLE